MEKPKHLKEAILTIKIDDKYLKGQDKEVLREVARKSIENFVEQLINKKNEKNINDLV